MSRGGLSTGLYDVRRRDGRTVLIAGDYEIARAARSLPGAAEVFWIPAGDAPARLATIRAKPAREAEA